MSVSVRLVEQHILHQANFSVEETRSPEGAKTYTLHFDIRKGDTAERTTIPFEAEGFANFLSTCQSVKSGLTLATALPPPPAEAIH